jgi:hypothetical protein
MAPPTAAALANDLLTQLSGKTLTKNQAAAVISTVLRSNTGGVTPDAIKAALVSLRTRLNASATATAGLPPPTGACHYDPGTGLTCAPNVTQAQCTALGGDWYAGQECMLPTFEALLAAGLADPPKVKTTAPSGS